MTSRVNVAMVGYGFMGRAHANAWRQVARFFDCSLEPELAVVCGRSEGPLAEAASKLGFREHASSWESVVARDDIQIVDICTPGDFHEAIAVAAAEAGKAIASERDIVDDSFDVGILVVVPDERRLAEYLAHPIHQRAKNDVLMPLVEKVLVYDFKR